MTEPGRHAQGFRNAIPRRVFRHVAKDEHPPVPPPMPRMSKAEWEPLRLCMLLVIGISGRPHKIVANALGVDTSTIGYWLSGRSTPTWPNGHKVRSWLLTEGSRLHRDLAEIYDRLSALPAIQWQKCTDCGNRAHCEKHLGKRDDTHACVFQPPRFTPEKGEKK